MLDPGASYGEYTTSQMLQMQMVGTDNGAASGKHEAKQSVDVYVNRTTTDYGIGAGKFDPELSGLFSEELS